MPQKEDVLRILVASPSDVLEEREKLEHVVKEVNQILGLHHRIRFDLIRWETNTRPAVGSDAQAIINKQIGDDYDVFLGILWMRFGTPTPRAASGTQEEFERAYNRYKSDPSSIEIMLYFKEAAPTSLNDIDTEQLQLVREFRKQFGDKGLYRTFNSTEEFEKLTRLHLISLAREWEKKTKKEVQTHNQEEKSIDLLGLLELIENWDENMSATTESLQSLHNDIQYFTKKVQETTQEIKRLQLPKDSNKIKRVLNSFAHTMHLSAIRIDSSRSVFKRVFDDAMSSIEKIAIMAPNFGTGTTGGGITRIPQDIHLLQTPLKDVSTLLAIMRTLVETIPNMTAKFSQEKSKLIDSLQGLEQDIGYALSLSIETEKTMRKIIE